jgi:pimeloyl-ACP methyl ester carboxylesterase
MATRKQRGRKTSAKKATARRKTSARRKKAAAKRKKTVRKKKTKRKARKSSTRKKTATRKKRKTRKKTTKRKTTAKRKTAKRKTTPRRKKRTTRKAAAPNESGFNMASDAIEDALLDGEHMEKLESYFGEQAYAELVALAGQARRRGPADGHKVLILPGIMGSKLGSKRLVFENTIWFDPFDVALGRLSTLALGRKKGNIRPVGVILLAYLRLKLHLRAAGFNAVFHAFDWRQGIPALGTQLKGVIESETDSDQGVSIVAHSMGGLVARSAMGLFDEEKSPVRRLIMLGTPNHGSFVPVQALRGVYSIVRKVAMLDLKHSAEELAEDVFGTFPGLYQMLPFRDRFASVDLYQQNSWPKKGPRPASQHLRAAPKAQETLPPGGSNQILIAGVGQETTTDLAIENGKFVYTISEEGDGTVPLDFAKLAGVETYYVEESHGSLPNNRSVERAVTDLLRSGETEELPKTWSPSRRGGTRRVEEKDLEDEFFEGRRGAKIGSRELRSVLEEVAAPLAKEVEVPLAPGAAVRFHGTSAEPIVVGRRRQRRIDLRLAQGSITQVDTRAIVLGLFRDVAPSGPAAAVDKALDGAITEFTTRRMFTGKVGEIFVLPAGQQRLRADMVVFVGLGAFDKFDEEVLRLAAENLVRALIRTKIQDFAAVLIGSGSASKLRDSLSSLVEGCFAGLLDSENGELLHSMTLCEMDRGRFQEMKGAVLDLATTSLFDEVEVTVSELHLPPEPELAPPPRTTAVARPKEDPLYLVVRQEKSEQGRLHIRSSALTAGNKAAVVSDVQAVSEKDLRAEVRRVVSCSVGFSSLPAFGTKIGEMVLPASVRTVLSRSKKHPILVIHDSRTGLVPWETLCIDGWFPAGTAGLTRKYAADDLSVAKWLDERRYGTVIDLLLVVNPTEDLDGAEEEGKRVREMFGGNPGVRIRELHQKEATWDAVRAAFHSGRYDTVHYAGHAQFYPNERSKSGLVCAGHKVLTGADLAGLSRLPALVFFNACESARTITKRAGKKLAKPETAKLADELLEKNVGLAEAFLRGGVANYVGTFWEVGDAGAVTFAKTFYTKLLSGETIGDSLLRARNDVRDIKEVDWVDYIHYGSPGFVLKEND